MSKSYARSKKNFISTAVASFVGIMAAIPITIGLYSFIGGNAGAIQDQEPNSTAQVSGVPADFAKFAFAYNQGYMAQAKSTSTGSSATAGTCTDAVTAESGEVLGTSTNNGQYKPHAELAEVVKSYNTYESYVYNSSSISNTNSNNEIGSNNTNKTEIDIEDSEKLAVNVDNENEAKIDESFNTENKTETETEISGSFNPVSNTTTETKTVAVNKVDDSYNIETETKTEDSNNSIAFTKEETESTIFNNDSNNTIGDVKVEIAATPEDCNK